MSHAVQINQTYNKFSHIGTFTFTYNETYHFCLYVRINKIVKLKFVIGMGEMWAMDKLKHNNYILSSFARYDFKLDLKVQIKFDTLQYTFVAIKFKWIASIKIILTHWYEKSE